MATLSASQSRAADFNKRLQHGFEIEGRAADDLENVGGGGLLLQRFAQIICALLHLVKLPRIFDRNHGLVGEGGEQLDLLIGDRRPRSESQSRRYRGDYSFMLRIGALNPGCHCCLPLQSDPTPQQRACRIEFSVHTSAAAATFATLRHQMASHTPARLRARMLTKRSNAAAAALLTEPRLGLCFLDLIFSHHDLIVAK